ncbi:flagellar hook-length control protein FliK [Cryobacterium sp. SO2]|uniref:flagellar hook-length control protein FliK n=1 Tax=Cryobacterium sp. SO2 TaxID=1897060 RepID=UPI0023DB84B4|nr:flagellar hook-length control protein FliK [Cryobacterium sp. SO2]WEO78978.1 flagellar hook-length control protein FliK [Cryobacterium sp. SO2]
MPGASADAAAATPATPAATAVAVPTPPGSVIQPVVPAPAQNVPAQATGTPMPVPLVGQVARPLFSLAAAGPGEHTLSISVTPDNLGPVVVRALITATGVRLELFAPTDLARDALRLILPDLRRDLAGGALPASLDLSSRSQPGDTGSSARQDRQAAADAFAQGGAAFGDGSRGGDQTRQPARGDAWLRPTPVTAIDSADSASDAVADGDITAGTGAGSAAGIRRGRVDVFA